MPEQNTFVSASAQKQRLLALFERLVPLVDGLADTLRGVLIIGLLLLIWVGVWMAVLKPAIQSVSELNVNQSISVH
ncbi:hypothetical protein [Crenothrix polyspora]|uniref:Uncharacterized protein n=1 Tax=Crenothrix polyspora TaxID=360316 RepID=A0A1R4HE73_9GAMM|nr:hypothetical protein [Crenothrix polyspora]SJM94514.1 hypothetical protein CRENPOLYSF1_550002 [Crenothrix polyspora]